MTNKKIFSILFFSLFATVTGMGIVVPLLPVYAHDLGASGLYIGLIFGAFSLSRTFFLPYFGRLSDKKGRKPFIISGLFAYALISIAFLFSNSVNSLIFVRFVQGIASAMVMPVILAYVGDITPPGREGLFMGLFNMSMFMGLSVGPLLGGMINERFSLHATFVCMGLLALLGFFLSYFMLPPTASESALLKKKAPVAWSQLLSDRDLAGLSMFRFAYAACIGIIWAFIPVLADSEFSATSSQIGVLVMLGVLISGLVHTPMGWVADRCNRKAIVGIGGLVVGAAMLVYYLAGSFMGLMGAGVLFGIGGGISMPALMAMAVLKGQHTDSMGSVMALLTMAHSLGLLLGSFLGGFMMDVFDLRQAFMAGTAVMIFGMLFFMAAASPSHGLQKA